MAAEFKEHHVVPDVFETWPERKKITGAEQLRIAHVEYDTKNNVNLGNHLDVVHTQKQPPRVYFPTKKGHSYTLFVLDPDAPSRKTHEFRHYLHWLVVNIPGTGSDHIDVTTGRVIAPYMGPAPPKGTGPHRYVFAVFDQKEFHVDITPIDRIDASDKRKSFDHHEFLKQHYKPQPDLLAGNFFIAEH